MQQGIGGGGGGGGGPTTAIDQSQPQLVEAASPISSRPPAAGNFDELIRFSSGGGGDDVLSGGVSSSSSNRWPRQETLTLLKIRSDMDPAFRDASIKGPLWEDVSRKLAELGYKRSAKKCREKFENVHKYHKRTKEGRSGRQDGKSYKFFSELEALQGSTANSAATPAANVSMSVTTPPSTAGNTLDVAPVSVGIPMPISSDRISPNTPVSTIPMSSPPIFTMTQPIAGSGPAPPAPVQIYNSAAAQFGISFSPPEISTSSEGSEDEDEEVGADASGISRKRKRPSSSGGGSGTKRMMQFLEGLMKQVMQKQEAMQQRFLEAIEKRDQDRMVREEAWKRQEIARLAREQELLAQERALAASRDSVIVSFLQKITGQTIQLPRVVPIPTVTPPDPPAAAAPPQQLHHQHQPHRSQNSEVAVKHLQTPQAPISSEVVMAIPEKTVPPQDIGGSGGSEATSSRWPKAEVVALINVRSGLESRYQEAGPKGPLWEEISARMLQMGYKRNAKRCKEKWENINKYYKKVKESNKQRPEDAKTCPYFHQLDALHRKKILGSGVSSGSFGGQQRPENQPSEQNRQLANTQEAPPLTISNAPQSTQVVQNEIRAQDASSNSSNGEPAKKPEDIMRELMDQQEIPHQQPLAVEDYEKMGDPNSDHDMDEDEEDEDDDELDEHRKMAYKIEFQRQNSGPPSGGGNGAPSFLTMVQ